ncbi:MAG TPA: PIN domain-containing protein [Candidatus Competibacter sp.]|nr:PIN domain-containing protein [Candidatus Competibacter sp.]
MKTNYVLIDYENVQIKSLALLKDEHFHMRVFLGPNNTKLPVELVIAMQELGERAEYIVLETAGRNALDFHIAYYLGALASKDPLGFFHIISKDTGFDPLIQHLKSKKIFAARSASIEEMPCFVTPLLAQQPKIAAPQQQKSDTVPCKPTREEFISMAVDDLIRRKASKPRTVKTLCSTIHARCGKGIPSSDIDAIYEALVKQGYVRVEGTKITYKLPAAKP